VRTAFQLWPSGPGDEPESPGREAPRHREEKRRATGRLAVRHGSPLPILGGLVDAHFDISRATAHLFTFRPPALGSSSNIRFDWLKRMGGFAPGIACEAKQKAEFRVRQGRAQPKPAAAGHSKSNHQQPPLAASQSRPGSLITTRQQIAHSSASSVSGIYVVQYYNAMKSWVFLQGCVSQRQGLRRQVSRSGG